MTTSRSAAPGLKKALHDLADELWNADDPTVLVTYGMPAFDPFEDVVSFGSTTVTSEPAGASQRHPRDEFISQEVIFYCFRAGGQEQEQVVMERAYDLLGDLEEYLLATSATVDGSVLQCFLTDHGSDAATDQEVLSSGRMHVLTATFTARNRIIQES